VRRIAMVCLGNICRSPMAESVAGALIEEAGLSDHFSVESFGTAGYHIGQPADPQADAALSRGGWRHGHHRARQLSRADLESLDLVLCADQANVAGVQRLAGHLDLGGPRVRLLRSYDPDAGPAAEVPDPWGLDDRDFDRVLEMIERACRGLVTSLASSLSR
jgi:protein-tyrosine phosphatase